MLIARSRAAITATQQYFADSFDRLAESQKLLGRGNSPIPPTSFWTVSGK
jgi:hypothetical protein